MIVVDDARLLAIVAEQDSPAVAPFVEAVTRGEVFTTGCWYWRLTRALSRPGHGALSRVRDSLAEDEQRRVQRSLGELPEEIGLLSRRRLVPVMAALPAQLNLLNAEAVAVAVVLGGTIAVTMPSPILATVASSAGVDVEVLTL